MGNTIYPWVCLKCVLMLTKKMGYTDVPKRIHSPQTVKVASLLPPHDLELERAALGACLLEDQAIWTLKRYFHTELVFYLPMHQVIFKSMLDMLDQHVKIDLLTLPDFLRKRSKWADINSSKRSNKPLHAISEADLLQLSARVASSAHLESHCQLLYELFMRRKGMEVGLRLFQDAANLGLDIFDTLQSASGNTRASLPHRMLQVEAANQAIERGAHMERKKMILGNLLKTDEIAFLFGEEGTGKSILAWQMGDAASRGTDLFPTADDPLLRNEANARPVILIDFEMDEDELFSRSTSQGERFFFRSNFKRCSIHPDYLDMAHADRRLMSEIEALVARHQPKLLIIDNITYIASESSDPSIAVKFMKHLKAIQKTYALSILVIAHTLKMRDKSLPLETRHMMGASGLKNFAKSIFVLGQSRLDPDLRYIKHLKCRNGQRKHDQDQVIECVVQRSKGRLCFEWAGLGRENSHLQMADVSEKKREAIEFAFQLQQSHGTGLRKLSALILEKFNIRISHSTLGRKLKEYQGKPATP